MRSRRSALLLGLWLAVASTGLAGPPDDGRPREGEKAEIIRQLIELTEAARLEAVFSQAFIDRIIQAIALLRPSLDAHTLAVIEQEARAVISERVESGDLLYSVLYPVYQKHFNLFELSQLVEFYQSPVGQKLVRVSPQLLRETLQLGSQWGLSLVPEIIERVNERLTAPDTAAQR